MKKAIVSLAVGALMLVGMTAQAAGPKIGVTIYKYDDNFMSFVRRSVDDGIKKGKAEALMNDSQGDQAKQNEQVDTLIARGVKALAINLVDPKAAQTIIDKAAKKKLPVVFFNKEPDQSVLDGYAKCWYVGTQSKEAGIIQGKMIAKLWNDNKAKWDKNKDGVLSYVLLKGEPGHPDAEARTQYAISTLKDAGVKVEELALDTAMWDSGKAADKIAAWLSKFGDKMEFIIANNDGMALGAVAALDNAGYFKNDKFMPVVGVDAIPDALTKIKEGKMVGTVLNDAGNQGKATAELSVAAANGKDPMKVKGWKWDGKSVRVPYVEVTLSNIKIGEAAYK